MGALAIGLGLAGCLTEPGRPIGGGSGSGDTCRPVVEDTFEPGTLPCQPWAAMYGSAGVDLVGGELRVTPGANRTSDGGCRNGPSRPIGAAGMLVEVTNVVTGPGSYTVMRTEFGGVEMGVSEGKLRLYDNPNLTEEITYIPDDMRWWRLRLDPAEQSLVADYSPDGEAWIELDRVTRPITMTTPELVGGVFVDNNPAPSFAAFATFRICGI